MAFITTEQLAAVGIITAFDMIQGGKMNVVRALENSAIIIGSNIVDKRQPDLPIQLPALSKQETYSVLLMGLKEKLYHKKNLTNSGIEMLKMLGAQRAAKAIFSGTAAETEEENLTEQQ